MKKKESRKGPVIAVIIIIIAIIGIVFMQHKKKIEKEQEQKPVVHAPEQVVEQAINAAPEDDQVKLGLLDDMATFIANDKHLSKYFSKDDMKIEARDDGTHVYIDKVTEKTGYPEDVIDLFVIPIDGSEPYDCDGLLGLQMWLQENDK